MPAYPQHRSFVPSLEMPLVNPDGQRDGERAGPHIAQVLHGGESLRLVEPQRAEHHLLVDGADLMAEDLGHVFVGPPQLLTESLPGLGCQLQAIGQNASEVRVHIRALG